MSIRQISCYAVLVRNFILLGNNNSVVIISSMLIAGSGNYFDKKTQKGSKRKPLQQYSYSHDEIR